MFKVGSFFAGVGGIDLGLAQTGHFQTVYANEKDPYPISIFETNFDIKVDNTDICLVTHNFMPDFDVLCAGFPCQAFSIAGQRKGFDDNKGRGKLFFELLRIIRAKKPRVVLLENVKNLVSHNKGETFKVILQALANTSYHCKYQVLDACEYGNVPQHRERLFIVGFLGKAQCKHFTFPDKLPLTTKLEHIIDFDIAVEDKYYYEPKYYWLTPDTVKNMTPGLSYIKHRKEFRENRSGVLFTLTAAMGTGGSNVPLVKSSDGRVRKLTPRECFRGQGFPDSFKLPSSLSDTRLYKAAGNSVAVPVIKRIGEQIIKVL